jgi:hypothetical protein
VLRIQDVFSQIPDPNFFHPGSASKNLSILTQMVFLSSRKYDPCCSSWIPDPWVKKALDSRSGPATLHNKCFFILPDGTLLNKIKTRAGLLAVSQVLKNLEREISLNSDLAESGRILFSFLVKISHKDFELWWKHCRKTENKVLYVTLMKI